MCISFSLVWAEISLWCVRAMLLRNIICQCPVDYKSIDIGRLIQGTFTDTDNREIQRYQETITYELIWPFVEIVSESWAKNGGFPLSPISIFASISLSSPNLIWFSQWIFFSYPVASGDIMGSMVCIEGRVGHSVVFGKRVFYLISLLSIMERGGMSWKNLWALLLSRYPVPTRAAHNEKWLICKWVWLGRWGALSRVWKWG